MANKRQGFRPCYPAPATNAAFIKRFTSALFAAGNISGVQDKRLFTKGHPSYAEL